jgi:hypothetical protein
MYSKPNWSVSEWGSQVVDANNSVILTAPDFLSVDDRKFVKSNIWLASHAPEMLMLLNKLVDKNLISNETEKELVSDFLQKINSKL